ncbi:secreted RxLR effector protein 161-like [Ziziphus jujuba]|uniref:Secreted RxLR effector protein 161-like n=1 Tax=Ziziphus jujuba TaxID=326968 RepID=A0ABM4A2Q7_ZIZJJ|nr:secreted RxLR effector protein 161-like [Ziziphus jujuba]
MALNEKLHKDDGAEKVDAKNYRSLVGCLIYLTNTRLDIVFAVSYVSRFMHELSKNHHTAAKRILHYLQGTRKLGIKYAKEADNKLIGYIDNSKSEKSLDGDDALFRCCVGKFGFGDCDAVSQREKER